MREKLEELFAKYVRNEGNDRAEVKDFLTMPENQHLMHSVEFVDTALRYASALYVRTEALEDDDYVLIDNDSFDGDEA